MTVEWIASCAACTVAAVVNVAALAFRYSDQGTRKSANASSSSLPPARYSSATGVSLPVLGGEPLLSGLSLNPSSDEPTEGAPAEDPSRGGDDEAGALMLPTAVGMARRLLVTMILYSCAVVELIDAVCVGAGPLRERKAPALRAVAYALVAIAGELEHPPRVTVTHCSDSGAGS